MNNIKEYLKWRGDITFQQVPYNEVDAYVLAKIGTPDLTGIIPDDGTGIKLKEAYQLYFSRKDIDPDYFGRLSQPILVETLRLLPQTARFGDLILSDYLEKINTSANEQISALTVTLPGGLTVVTFRGTDDTIVGWKEDFLMAVRDVVPAQKDAAEYLTRIALTHSGPLAVIGHSKGGNLAVYASVTASEKIQDRITCVYNFDGPGFRQEFWEQPGVKRIQNKISNYVSQHTMVGTLLTQSENMTICRSMRTGHTAHEVCYWEVSGPAFVREKKLSTMSAKLDRLIDRQLEELTNEEISNFVEDFFKALSSTGATTLTELSHQSPEHLHRILKEINSTESIREFGKEFFELVFEDKRRLNGVLKQLRTVYREFKL